MQIRATVPSYVFLRQFHADDFPSHLDFLQYYSPQTLLSCGYIILDASNSSGNSALSLLDLSKLHRSKRGLLWLVAIPSR